jgi:serine/threonine-protein kinase HipA
MTDALLVIFDDQTAGTVTRLRGARLRFDYTDAYRERSGGTPLSLSMPIQVQSHPDQVVRSWLWGLLHTITPTGATITTTGFPGPLTVTKQ